MEVKTDEEKILKEKESFDLVNLYTQVTDTPEVYMPLEMEEIEKIIQNIYLLSPSQMSVFAKRVAASLQNKDSDPELKEIIRNWWLFLAPYLHPFEPRKIPITIGEFKEKISVLVDGTPISAEVYQYKHSKKPVSDILLQLTPKRIYVASTQKFREKTETPISPLLYPDTDDKLAKILTPFLSKIIYSISFNTSKSATYVKSDWITEQQQEVNISGYFSVLEILEILKGLKGLNIQPLVNNLIESIDTRLKSIFSDFRPSRSEFERLCDLTWPLTAYVLNKYVLRRLKELNFNLQPSYQTY